MICFAGLVPHPPLLIPEIGQEHTAKLSQTAAAYQTLAHELYVSQPQTILLITSHGDIGDKFFTINQNPVLRTQFKEFGDFISNLNFSNDIALGYKIKESCETSLPLALVAREIIDYGAAVPLYFLTKNLPAVKVVIVTVSNLDRNQHLRLGQAIKEVLESLSERVAVLASGDLSHRLHKDSPAGFSVHAQEFDQALRSALAQGDVDKIVNIDESLLREAGECGYRSLLILLGIIRDYKFHTEELAYEAPFGIGYLSANFRFQR